jgi:hypothetical protein
VAELSPHSIQPGTRKGRRERVETATAKYAMKKKKGNGGAGKDTRINIPEHRRKSSHPGGKKSDEFKNCLILSNPSEPVYGMKNRTINFQFAVNH